MSFLLPEQEHSPALAGDHSGFRETPADTMPSRGCSHANCCRAPVTNAVLGLALHLLGHLLIAAQRSAGLVTPFSDELLVSQFLFALSTLTVWRSVHGMSQSHVIVCSGAPRAAAFCMGTAMLASVSPFFWLALLQK